MDHGRQLLSDLEARVCAAEVLRRVGIAHADAVVGCEARGQQAALLAEAGAFHHRHRVVRAAGLPRKVECSKYAQLVALGAAVGRGSLRLRR